MRPGLLHAACAALLSLVAACAAQRAAAPASADAQVARLRAELVHAERLDPASPLWAVDAAAVAERIDDAKARELFAPLASSIQDLSLARSGIGAGSLDWLARCTELRRLDVRGCKGVDDAFVSAVAHLPKLEELVLSRTSAGDGCIDALLAAPALRRVWLWKSAATPQGLARMAAKPGLLVDAGAKPDAAPSEKEPKVEFVNLLPLPGEAPLETAKLPVNVNCPVSGAPVDAHMTRVYKGRVIGFCCGNCPKQFDEDPAKFEANLPKP